MNTKMERATLLVLAAGCLSVLGLQSAAASLSPRAFLAAGDYSDPNGNTHVVCQDDPTQSYELYIPASAPTTEPSPILYAFDPGANGKSALLSLAAAAAENGWIVAASNNSKNGPWTDIFVAQDALLHDTEQRLNLHPMRRFAAGMSGGARASLALAFRYPAKICGTLCIAAGWPINTDLQPSTNRLITYIIIGTQDSNYTEDIPETQGELTAHGIRCVVREWNAGHVWPPPNMVMTGCRWLKANAEIDPNAGLLPAACPASAMVCQAPAGPTGSWRSYVSDTANGSSLLERFQGAGKSIARVDWWAISSTYNSRVGYWLPAEPGAETFRITLRQDAGGNPGGIVHQETVPAVREDLPRLYLRNYPLRHYSVQFTSPVALASGWVQIEQLRQSTDPMVLWLSAAEGDGYALECSSSTGVYSPITNDLAVSLSPAELKLTVRAMPTWGKPPLTVDFSGALSGNFEPVVNWRWDFGDGSIEDGDNPSPSHEYTDEDVYTVSLTVTTASDSVSVTKQDLVVVSHEVPVVDLAATLVLCVLLAASGCVCFVRRRI